MKLNLPSVTAAFWVSMMASGIAQSPDDSKSTPTSEGNRLVANAAQKVLALPSLTANIRQHVKLFGREINGNGKYIQLGGNSGVMRLDLKLMEGKHLVANVTQALHKTQVRGENGASPAGEEIFYSSIKYPRRASTTSIDMRRVRQAIGTLREAPLDVSATSGMMPGGLTALLRGLADNFQFQQPRAESYRNVRVWVVQGSWKPEKLAKLLPDQQKEILAGKQADLDKLPKHVPASVVLILGRDEYFNLFPYRIEYFRQASPTAAKREGNPVSGSEAIVTIEFTQLQQRPNLKLEDCRYNSSGQTVVDITDQYLRRLRSR